MRVSGGSAHPVSASSISSFPRKREPRFFSSRRDAERRGKRHRLILTPLLIPVAALAFGNGRSRVSAFAQRTNGRTAVVHPCGSSRGARRRGDAVLIGETVLRRCARKDDCKRTLVIRHVQEFGLKIAAPGIMISPSSANAGLLRSVGRLRDHYTASGRTCRGRESHLPTASSFRM
jgi:hypothetical protein